jgi:hypothetical protein
MSYRGNPAAEGEAAVRLDDLRASHEVARLAYYEARREYNRLHKELRMAEYAQEMRDNGN